MTNPIAEKIIAWQQQHGRHQLPWQQHVTPYKVLVSELMLQQTQVVTVIPYFERWMRSFPTVEALAQADEDQVMQHWQGLGYYARARNLHKAARFVAERGAFPEDLTELLQVPGVGRYTAGAIMSFAYDRVGPIVDGNVRRLFARLFALDGIPNSTALEKKLWALAEQYTPQQNNRCFAQGLLDLGATVCKPKAPLCDLCPLAADCQALARNAIDQYPNPKPKKQIPVKAGHFVLMQLDGCVYVEKRPSPGIWAALWCLPQLEHPPQAAQLHGGFSHQFSHYKLEASVWLDNSVQDVPSTGRWVALADLDQIGLPAPLKVYLSSLK